MRALLVYWTFITLLLASSNLTAQKSAIAVMNVSVTVVSGSAISDVERMNINFEEQTVQAGSFAFSTAKFTDTNIQHSPIIHLENEFGETLELESDSTLLSENFVHTVNVSANIDDLSRNLRGIYSGEYTTTIDYF